MSKKIEISYCAQNGLGTQASNLKIAVKQAFPDVKIENVANEEGNNRI